MCKVMYPSRVIAAAKGVRVVNLDRKYSLPGGPGSEYDSAVVLSETETEPNLLTREPQSKRLFLGTLKEAHEFVARLPHPNFPQPAAPVQKGTCDVCHTPDSDGAQVKDALICPRCMQNTITAILNMQAAANR